MAVLHVDHVHRWCFSQTPHCLLQTTLVYSHLTPLTEQARALGLVTAGTDWLTSLFLAASTHKGVNFR